MDDPASRRYFVYEPIYSIQSMLIHCALSYAEAHDLILGANYLVRRLRQAAANASRVEREVLLSQAQQLETAAQTLIDASEHKLGLAHG